MFSQVGRFGGHLEGLSAGLANSCDRFGDFPEKQNVSHYKPWSQQELCCESDGFKPRFI